MTAVAIDGASILSADGRFATGTVLIAEGVIAAVSGVPAERAALRARAGETLDARGCWLVPGLVSAHTHAYGTLLRGTRSALPLELWSLYTIAYGAAFDAAAISAALLLHAAECIRGGITGIVDHFPNIRHAAAALEAHEASGLRVLFAAFVQDLSDYDLLAIEVPEPLRELAAVAPVDIPAYTDFFAGLLATARAGSGRVRVALGPNAPQRCSPALWSLWRTLRDRHAVAVHCHALETRAQARIAQRRWPAGGMIAALDDAGLLTEGLSLAHAIYTTPAERTRLARRDVAVSHNPLSNLTLGSGIMPLTGYLAAGVRVGIGSDAANCGGRHDLFELMRLALTLPRVAEADFHHWPSAAAILEMATANGSRIVRNAAEPAGIVPGAAADLVLVRRDNALTLPLVDNVEAFVSQAGRDAVEAVMIAGRWVLSDNRILSFDEARVMREVADAHAAVAERSAAMLPEIDRALETLALQVLPWLQPL